MLITTNGDLSTLAGGQSVGDLIVLLASLAWAFFFVLSRRMLMRVEQNAFGMATLVMIPTALLTLPTAIIFGNLDTYRSTAHALPLVVYAAFVCTLLPFVLWTAALKTATATVATLVGLLEILTAMIMSTLLLGETYSTITLIGAFLILASLLTVVEK